MADTESRGDRKKRKRRRNRRMLVLALSAALVTGRAPAVCAEESGAPQEQTAETPEELSALYAASAVLMDGESGRILFEKNGGEIRPMASTTKIMTCILALEHLPEDAELSVSALAASQPEVRLGMREGETYVLKDLLHSLMLESHNDSAVAIAEAVSGTVEGFAELMNEKAEELGCSGTCFLTPNGLDAEKEEDGKTLVHSTTAADLARIMRYCTMESPEKERFRQITGTERYSFSSGGRSFSCVNHNAFLNQMEGAFSGKTGFTANAGYCYVGALERDGKTLIVALLACGWPNNKSYKWSDTRKLMDYGLEHYEYREIYQAPDLSPVPVAGGIPDSGELTDTAYAAVSEIRGTESQWKILMKAGENVEVRQSRTEELEAPAAAGTLVGTVTYALDGETVASSEIRTAETVQAVTFFWCISKIIENFLIKV